MVLNLVPLLLLFVEEEEYWNGFRLYGRASEWERDRDRGIVTIWLRPFFFPLCEFGFGLWEGLEYRGFVQDHLLFNQLSTRV